MNDEQLCRLFDGFFLLQYYYTNNVCGLYLVK